MFMIFNTILIMVLIIFAILHLVWLSLSGQESCDFLYRRPPVRFEHDIVGLSATFGLADLLYLLHCFTRKNLCLHGSPFLV